MRYSTCWSVPWLARIGVCHALRQLGGLAQARVRGTCLQAPRPPVLWSVPQAKNAKS